MKSDDVKNEGNVKITEEVVAGIAGSASLNVEGVHSLSGGFVDGLTEIFGKKNLTKGVNVDLKGSNCNIDVSVIMKHGYKFSQVAGNIQKCIKRDIKKMVGIIVETVNVYVNGVKITEVDDISKEQIPVYNIDNNSSDVNSNDEENNTNDEENKNKNEV